MKIKGFNWAFLVLALLIVSQVACASYVQDLQDTVADYQRQAHYDLMPDFALAHEHYPPQKLALLIFKDERVIELWAGHGKTWSYIRDFDILGASGGPGPKLRSGDRQVPEGVYKITMLNPYSKYDLSLMINYPDAFDRLHARLDHRDHLGGDIFIHGGNCSIGCVAIGNHAIEDLFVLVYEVGKKNVKVIIAPNDLRVAPPILAKHSPRWIKSLNRQIKSALAAFPLHKVDAHQI